MNADMVEIGHAMIECPTCGQLRHVPVYATTRPVARRRTATFRCMLRGNEHGQVHVELRAGRDGHRCGGGGPGTPAEHPGGLTLVQEVAS